jgi:hypothetical protein
MAALSLIALCKSRGRRRVAGDSALTVSHRLGELVIRRKAFGASSSRLILGSTCHHALTGIPKSWRSTSRFEAVTGRNFLRVCPSIWSRRRRVVVRYTGRPALRTVSLRHMQLRGGDCKRAQQTPSQSCRNGRRFSRHTPATATLKSGSRRSDLLASPTSCRF